MNENRTKRNRLLADRVIRGLQSRNMEGFYVETKEEALKTALELIPEGSSISWGGTMSAGEIGLKDALCSGSYTVYNRDGANNPEEKRAAELAAYDCDFFLASTNAITEDGVMVNVDGYANRVSAIAAGPRTVLMIVGMNKVVKHVEDAFSRARNEAAPINAQRAPINAQRFGVDTPCSKNGMCYDCKSPDTICCQILITRFSMIPGRIKVILVNDELGF